MIQVDEILDDFDVCSAFTIFRKTGNFVAGGWQQATAVVIPALGAIRNANGREIEMTPEADRVHELLTFRSTTQMFVTNGAGAMTSDVLQYQDSNFRVLAVKNYSDQGYWWAIAARMTGN